MLYKYIALGRNGRKVTGELEAKTVLELKQKLKSRKLILLTSSRVKTPSKFSGLFYKISSKDIAFLTMSLSIMIDSGMNLTRAIDILKNQSENIKLKVILTQVNKNLISGVALSEALSKYPKYFNNIYISMIKVGESSGTLNTVLLSLANSLEKQEEIKHKIKSALIYPSILSLVSICFMFLMMIFIIPQFMILFKGTSVKMPPLTLMIINMSDFMRKFWYLIILVVGLSVYGIKYILKSSKGLMFFDAFILEIPFIGKFIQKAAMARFTMTMSTLLGSGVSILEVFDILAETVGNSLIAAAIINSKESVKSGSSIHKPLADSGQFPLLITNMIEVGEDTGKLPEILSEINHFTEMELEVAVKNLLTAFEPFLILLMSIGVGILIIAMYLPLFRMADIIE